jgi:hypothetical protein
VAFPASCRTAAERLAGEDWLFPGWRKGRHMNTESLQTVCREAARAAGLDKRVTRSTDIFSLPYLSLTRIPIRLHPLPVLSLK